MRLTGTRAGAILGELCSTPEPRRAALRWLRHRDEPLDHALVLWFPAPGSYTGEDAAELQLHGGPAVVEGVFEALVDLGARPAEPGEFTRRAFLHGKMDLTEAEGIADLIEAETQAQRRQALDQANGALAARCAGWAKALTDLLARQEAFIEFEDEDLPDGLNAAVSAGAARLREELAQSLATARQGESLRNGVRIALLGAPNAGKSSLFNALLGSEAAIVSPQAGTTRDVVQARLIIGGVPVTLSDTAGLRETDDAIEAEGVRRAHAEGEKADLVIALVEPGKGLDGALRELVAQGALLVCSKSDLGRSCDEGLPVSVRTGDGLPELMRALEVRVMALVGSHHAGVLTRPRHRAAISDAIAALDLLGEAVLPELAAEALRLALRSIGRLTGRVGVEAVLDAVFSEFCIGK